MSWLSAIIRFFADIKYNHVGIVVFVWDVPMLYEAVGRGIISTKFVDRVNDKDILISRPIPHIVEAEYARLASSFLGHTPYDVIGLIWHQLVLHVTGKWIGSTNKDKAKKRFYCYEYVAFMNADSYEKWYEVKPKEFLKASWHREIFKGYYKK